MTGDELGALGKAAVHTRSTLYALFTSPLASCFDANLNVLHPVCKNSKFLQIWQKHLGLCLASRPEVAQWGHSWALQGLRCFPHPGVLSSVPGCTPELLALPSQAGIFTYMPFGFLSPFVLHVTRWQKEENHEGHQVLDLFRAGCLKAAVAQHK